MDDLRTAMNLAVAQGKDVSLTFKTSAIAEVSYLIAMNNAAGVVLNNGDLLTLMAVNASGDWDGDHNRTVTITPSKDYNENWFLGRMGRALESWRLL